MAQTIRCDFAECPELGDVLITTLETGETVAWCGPHYIEAITTAVESMANAEADQADAEAKARLAAVEAPGADDDAELDAAAIEARIGGPDVIEATDDAIRDDEARAAFEAEQVAPDPTQPAHVIHRGQSARAQAHRAKRDTVLVAREGLERAAGESGFVEEPGDEDEDEDKAAPD